jgi:hypothetical protein
MDSYHPPVSPKLKQVGLTIKPRETPETFLRSNVSDPQAAFHAQHPPVRSEGFIGGYEQLIDASVKEGVEQHFGVAHSVQFALIFHRYDGSVFDGRGFEFGGHFPTAYTQTKSIGRMLS